MTVEAHDAVVERERVVDRALRDRAGGQTDPQAAGPGGVAKGGVGAGHHVAHRIGEQVAERRLDVAGAPRHLAVERHAQRPRPQVGHPLQRRGHRRRHGPAGHDGTAFVGGLDRRRARRRHAPGGVGGVAGADVVRREDARSDDGASARVHGEVHAAERLSPVQRLHHGDAVREVRDRGVGVSGDDGVDQAVRQARRHFEHLGGRIAGLGVGRIVEALAHAAGMRGHDHHLGPGRPQGRWLPARSSRPGARSRAPSRWPPGSSTARRRSSRRRCRRESRRPRPAPTAARWASPPGARWPSR